jgi:hypothetical protein
MRCGGEWVCRCKRYQSNGRAGDEVPSQKNLNVRHAKENKPTHGSYGDQKEKDGEEEPLQQSGEAAK